MSWTIHNIDNTVKIVKACAKDLFKVGNAEGAGPCTIWYSLDEVSYKGKLSFDPDHREHMDYIWYFEILEVLKKHKVNGDITFADLEGGYGSQRFWGYRFLNGEMTRLTGKVVFEVDVSNNENNIDGGEVK
jgi:hypothetical protein